MQHERAITLPSVSLVLLTLLSLLFPGQVVAQEKGPVFWTHGGNWGNWLKISAHPGLSIRTACGDDSTLKNYPVSSTDWQLRNNYTESMAVVWRVQFFNDTSGRNEMSGWMLEHLRAGGVLDGWNVEGGHCQARNFISVQVKCVVPVADEAKCYNSDGNPYPPRPDGAYSGDHNPSSSLTGQTTARGLVRKAGASNAKHGNIATQLVGTGWSCTVDTSWRYPVLALYDYRVTFLPASEALYALASPIGGIVVNYATWKTGSSAVSLQRDGSFPDPQYSNKTEEYFDQMTLEANSFPASSRKLWEDGADFMLTTFTAVTKDSLTGFVSVNPNQRDKFLSTVNDENKGDVDKQFPVTCKPHHP